MIPSISQEGVLIPTIYYKIKTANEKEIYSHLHCCNANFSVPLSQRVKIEEYSKKIFEKAITFEAWHGKELVGLVAAYLNIPNSFITNVSVTKEFMKKGIATELMNNYLIYVKEKNIKNISLEVQLNDDSTIRFYKKFDFKENEPQGTSMLMSRLF